jgi:hypothetical protein
VSGVKVVDSRVNRGRFIPSYGGMGNGAKVTQEEVSCCALGLHRHSGRDVGKIASTGKFSSELGFGAKHPGVEKGKESRSVLIPPGDWGPESHSVKISEISGRSASWIFG